MDYYSEEEFYQDNGWPIERLDYCDYIFCINNETKYGPDYDQFALVINAEYPYMVPWAGDWIYAMNSGDSYMAVRYEEEMS